MEDVLPEISIKIDVSHQTFLDRIKTILKSKNIEYNESEFISTKDVVHNKLIKHFLLDFNPKTDLIHDGIYAQFHVKQKFIDRIFINIRAFGWNPDPPTYETYSTAASILVKPIISYYNTKYKSKRRLCIQLKENTKPKLSKLAKKYFDRFTQLANKDHLHSNDYDHFYKFIRYCHEHSVKLIESDVKRLLFDAGFSEDISSHLADIYQHGRGLLKSYVNTFVDFPDMKN